MDAINHITDAMERGMRLKAFAQNLQFQAEEQQMRRQQMQMEMERMRQDANMQDFQTQLALSSMGALPVAPGNAGKLQAGLGGRGVLNYGSQQYSVPGAEERAQRAGKIAGAIKEAELDKTDPYVDIAAPSPAPGFGNTIKVRQSKAAEATARIVDAETRRIHAIHPNAHVFTKDDKQGNTTVIGINPADGTELYRKEYKGIGKPAATKTAAGADGIPKDAMKRYDAAVKAINEARGAKTNRERQEKWPAAEKMVNDLTRLYPQYFTGGRGQGGQGLYVDLKPQGGQAAGGKPQAASNQAAPQSPKGQRIKAANVPKAAAAMNMTPEQFSQWWHDNGGTILQ